jgi:hypothetical protein
MLGLTLRLWRVEKTALYAPLVFSDCPNKRPSALRELADGLARPLLELGPAFCELPGAPLGFAPELALTMLISTLLKTAFTYFGNFFFAFNFFSIFRARPFQWPSKWIFPHQNHYVPLHINNMYINSYTYLFSEHSVNIVCYFMCTEPEFVKL